LAILDERLHVERSTWSPFVPWVPSSRRRRHAPADRRLPATRTSAPVDRAVGFATRAGPDRCLRPAADPPRVDRGVPVPDLGEESRSGHARRPSSSAGCLPGVL